MLGLILKVVIVGGTVMNKMMRGYKEVSKTNERGK